jgi:hypothetical protein
MSQPGSTLPWRRQEVSVWRTSNSQRTPDILSGNAIRHMHIQWCLKGIKESKDFGDAEARALLSTGLKSNWLRNNSTIAFDPGMTDAQDALGPTALFNHVHNYGTFSAYTPYISLSAGIRRSDGGHGLQEFRAWETALDFATDSPTGTGYVYRVWTIVSPKPSPRLMGISDELRDLNQFWDYAYYNYEGEIAAKLLVPARQIHWVAKVAFPATQVWVDTNTELVEPDTITNLKLEF